MNRLFTASLPFWRTATSETFVLHVTGLTSPGQPPVTGLGAASPHLTLVNCPPPRSELALARAAGMLLWERIHFFPPSQPTEAGPWEGEEIFCCGRKAKGWLGERGSWRRRLGGAGFPAIVGEIFLLCFGRDRLTVAAGAAAGLRGRRWLLPPVPAGLPVLFGEGRRGPCRCSDVSARRCRAGSSGGYAAG